MARSLRVVAVTPLYPPKSRVGAWLTTHEFLAHLAAHGHDVHAVAYLGTEAYRLDGVTVWPRTCDPDEVLAGCDVMVSHLGDNQQAAGEAERRGLPMVRMVHGMSDDAADLLTDYPVALAAFNSASLRDAIPHDCPSIVVHPPAALAPVKPGRAVTLVNLSEEKGGRVFWQLARALPHVKFLGVRGGYGEQVSDKRKNVRVIPPTEDMSGDVYARTGVLLMPSARETWGRVGLEAMACGIPVVAHPTPGLVESLGSAGIFVDRDDLDGWKREVSRIVNDRGAWLEASERAREHAGRFSPADQLERFREAVEALA